MKSSDYRLILFESIHDGWWNWELPENTIFCSPRWWSTLGMEPDKLPVSPQFFQGFLHPGDRLMFSRLFDEILLKHDSRWEVPLRFRHKDGHYLFFLSRGSFERNTESQVVRIFGSNIALSDHLKSRHQNLFAEQELLVAAQEERSRLSYHIHDGIGQLLTAAAFQAAGLVSNPAHSAEVHEPASEIVTLIGGTMQRIRAITRGCSPVEVCENSLGAALQNLAQSCGTGFDIECIYCGPAKIRCGGDDHALQIYLIAQEAILNAVRHGKARSVEILLDDDSRCFRMVVRDNGGGMSGDMPRGKGIGIRSMRTRSANCNGSLQISSRPGGGTEVICEIPIDSMR